MSDALAREVGSLRAAIGVLADVLPQEVAALRTEIAQMAGEVGRLRSDFRTYDRGLHVLAEAVATMNEKLDTILEAVTEEPGPSPIHDLLQQLVHAVQEQGATLTRIEARLAVRPNGDGSA